MSYREPGVYVTYNTTSVNSAGATSPLLPCIVGSGAKFMKTKVQVIRKAGSQVDTLDYTAIGTGDFSILKVGQTSTSADYYDAEGIQQTTNYKTIKAQNDAVDAGTSHSEKVSLPTADYIVGVDESNHITITWQAESLTYTETSGTNLKNGYTEVQSGEDTFEVRKTRKPDDNFTYFVELIYPVNENNRPNQFEVNLISSDTDIYNAYGDILSYKDAKGTEKEINRIALGLYLAWLNAGGGSIYGLQVSFDSGLKTKPDHYDYSTALSKIQVIDSVYRIVPLDLNNNITDVVIDHVVTMSSPEEKMERRAFVSYSAEGSIDNFSQLSAQIGGFAQGIENCRIGVVNKYNASILTPEGTVINPIDVEGSEPFICAALAGLESSLGYQQSLTNRVLRGFNSIEDIVPLLRTQKNILASKGIILLEQTGGNNKLLTTVRHGLTTDMSSIETKENSITTILDYTGKRVRAALKGYIGKETISQELLARMEASANAILDEEIQSGILTDGSVADITQNEANPDTVDVTLSVLPPYPCNYINIVVGTE